MGIGGIIVLVVLFGWLAFSWYKEIASKFDYSRWASGAKPNKDAVILEVNTKKVKYIRNQAKFKSVVRFSDGFSFTTHQTGRKEHFGYYTISVSEEEISAIAKRAHRSALEELEAKGEKIYTVNDLKEYDPVRVALENQKIANEAEIVLDGGWRCFCGRVHQKFESSCVCGKTKAECKNKNT